MYGLEGLYEHNYYNNYTNITTNYIHVYWKSHSI